MNRMPALIIAACLHWAVCANAAFAIDVSQTAESRLLPIGGVQALTLAQNDLPSEQIRDAARRVMQQNEYRSVRRRVLENIPENDADKGFLEGMTSSIGTAIGDAIDSVLTWFSSLFSSRRQRPNTQSVNMPSSGLSIGLSQVLLYVAVIALVGAAIWIIAAIVRTSDGRNHSRDRSFLNTEEDLENLSVPPGELAASTYESRALQFAADGNFRAAIRELLLGSMSWIERAGLIRFRRGLTNRDYVRAVWRQEVRRDAYGVTALEFERVYFGRRDATEEMFRHCLTSFQKAFREEAATTAEV
ncbi:MAG: hypothetical protein R3C19_25535 [Planctomycetaceae bacterium]